MKKNGRYFFVFAIFVILYFWDVPVKGLSLAVGDGFSTYALMSIISEQYKDLSFPFWNPYEFSGFPILAAAIYNVFYLPEIILFMLFKPPIAYNLYLILSYVMAGFFMFLYVRRLGLDLVPSIAAGILYSLIGYLPQHLQHTTLVNSGAWLPLVLYCYEGIRREPGLRNAVLASFTVTIQLFSGHPQPTFYTAIVLLFFVTFHSFHIETPRRYGFVLWSALALIFSLLIALPQILASYELIQAGPQAAPSYEFFSQYSTPGYAVPAVVSPFLYGGFDGTAGTFAFFLAAVAFWRGEKTNIHVKFWGLMAVIAFLLALGDTLRPLNRIMFHVPVYNFFRAPGKHLVEVCFALSILAGFGMSSLINGNRPFRRALIIMLSIALSFAAVSRLLFSERLSAAFPALKEPGYSFYVPVALLLCYIVLLAFYGKLKRYAGYAILAFIFIEALSFKVPYSFPKDYADNYQKELFEFLKKDRENRAVFITLKIPYSLLAIPHGISSVDGYDTLMPHDYGELLKMRAFGYSEEWPDLIENNLILSMLNAKYLVVDSSYGELEDIRGLVRYAPTKGFDAPFGKTLPSSPDYEPVYGKVFEKDGIIAYENLNVLPRAYAVSKLKAVDTVKALRMNLYAFQLDPRREAAVSSEDIKEIGSPDFSEGDVRIIEYSPNEVGIEADFEGRGFLVLSDQYYPGWKAFVDGQAAKIYKINGAFRGIVVPPGRHEVVFRYSPGKIYAAMAASGLLLAGLMAALALIRAKKIAR